MRNFMDLLSLFLFSGMLTELLPHLVPSLFGIKRALLPLDTTGRMRSLYDGPVSVWHGDTHEDPDHAEP